MYIKNQVGFERGWILNMVGFLKYTVFAIECSICRKRVAVLTLKTFSFHVSLLSASHYCASFPISALFTEGTTKAVFPQAPVAAAKK